MTHFHRVRWELAALALGLLAGCGEEPQPKVTGTVTYDGRPVPSGTIIFHSIDRYAKSTSAKIDDGRYSAVLAPAPYRVHVVGDLVTRQMPRTYEEYHRKWDPRMDELKKMRGDMEAAMFRYAEFQEEDGQVPDLARGNRAVREVVERDQTLDVHLEKPVRRKKAN